jgi:membrane-bound lytic murein transglycosylase B
MRFSLRLVLIGTVAACAPMLPEPPPIASPAAPAPAPAAPSPTSEQPGPAPAPTPVVDQAGFEGWKQGFLARHGGARRAAYERELAGLTPDPSVIRLDGNQP